MCPPDQAFCRALPKVELHAHLTGSITRPILQEIWDARKASDSNFDVESPAVALKENAGQNIEGFFAHFNTYLYKLVSDLPSLLLATGAVLQAFQDDGVAYLELRTTPRAVGGTPEETIRAICGVLGEWQGPMKARLILSVDRVKHTGEDAMRIVDLASRLRDEGKPVVGVDLCGDVNTPIDVSIFREAFLEAGRRNLGLTVHFAEVPACSTRKELEEILSWNPKRLGHVIHVPEDLRDEIKRRGIAVELCLTCNVLAGMLPDGGSYADHHFKAWWGSPLSICTDDVGVFGSMPSEELLLVSQHFGLKREDLEKLCKDALQGAFGLEK